MTIEEILSSSADMLSAEEVSDIIGSDPGTLRLMVRINPNALAPLQPIMVGNRAKFPRMRFIAWYYGDSLNKEGIQP